MVLEQHLLIDWKCYFDSSKIHEYIEKYGMKVSKTILKFKVNKSIQTKKLSEFYSGQVNDYRMKQKFNIYIIHDNQNVYEKVEKHPDFYRTVNINMFKLKNELRNISGGYGIHATDNIQETKHNLKVLELFDTCYVQRKFRDLKEVFDILNDTNELQYVVTHGFENLLNIDISKKQDDIDFLTNDYFLFMNTLDTDEKPKGGFMNSISNGGTSVRNYICVANKQIPIDIRYAHDQFISYKFQKDILNNINQCKDMKVPINDLYMGFLLYHIVIHKNFVKQEYGKVLNDNGITNHTIENLKYMLDKFMQENNYEYVKPHDKTVGYFID